MKKPFLFHLYQILTILISPFLSLIWQNRVKNGKELQEFKSQRFGNFKNLLNEKIIWIHSASVGETTIGINIAREFSKINPNIKFIFTAQTISAKNLFEKAKLENSSFQFAPFDSPKIAKDFIQNLKPCLAIFIEGEIWPNLLNQLDKAKIPRIFINARLTKNSIKTWKKMPNFANFLFGGFKYIHCANLQTANDLGEIINCELSNIGNLKFATPKLNISPALIEKIKNETKDRKIWLAASTHEGEEEIILKAHKIICENNENVLLIIAPRHLTRTSAIENIAKSLNLATNLKSHNKIIKTEDNIFIWDSIGELGSAFKTSNLCFIAGSLLPKIGGHNPIEPAQLQCPIITGPYFHNFDDIFNEMIELNCVLKCETINENQIANLVLDILNNEDLASNLIINSSNFIKDKSDNMAIIIEKIKEFSNA